MFIYVIMNLGSKQKKYKRLAEKLERYEKKLGEKENDFDVPSQLGLLFANESYQPEEERKEELEGYNYDKELSAKREAVYVNPKKQNIYLAERGTKPSDPKDMWEDAKILTSIFGPNSTRPAQGSETIEKIKEKYPDYKLNLSGHSLGGSTSYEMGKKHDLPTFTFNRGAGIFQPFMKDPCNHPNPPSYCNKIKHYRILGDPVSFLGRWDHNVKTINNPNQGLLTKHLLTAFEKRK